MKTSNEKLSLAIANIEQARRNLSSTECFIYRILARNNEGVRAELSDDDYKELSLVYFGFLETCNKVDWIIQVLKEEQGWK